MPSDTSAPVPIPEPEPARKKPRRLWLYAPYVVLVLMLGGWGGYWVLAKGELEARLDARAEALRSAGYAVDLEGRQISGFPFRMKLSFAQARIAAPSGWALAIPGLTGEAYLHDLGHWVLVGTQGLTVTRPQGGAIGVRGEALRASLNGGRIVLQGTKLVFTPGVGARPFSLSGADLIELYLRPSPDGRERQTLIRMEGGKATAGTVAYRLAADKAITASVQATLSHPEAFQGRDWGSSVRAWAKAGGAAEGVQGNFTAGSVSAKTAGGILGVDTDGRLTGTLALDTKRAGAALLALAAGEALDPDAAKAAAAVAAARAQGDAATLNLTFQAGATTLGPVRIAPAPKVG